MASGLDAFINHTVSIITSDGRNFIGTLKGFDQTINIIIDESHERVYSTTAGVEQVMLGLHIIRGDNIMIVVFLTMHLFAGIFAEDEQSLNVGTVLFTKADIYKECWAPENVAVLTSRQIFEDLLPNIAVLAINSNEFVEELVEYFRLVLETVRHTTKGKSKHITLIALADLLGGYLNHAVLPIAKHAFYAGLIDYDAMDSLLVLFDELKSFLRTNGQGWAQPIPQGVDASDVKRLDLKLCKDRKKCANLIMEQDEDSIEDSRSKCDSISIPCPFFDSKTQPSSVAVPHKINPLYNLEASNSSYLLMNFFLEAYSCLQSKKAKRDALQAFTMSFATLVEEEIIPRLGDAKFYSAFGGILRVRLTIKGMGTEETQFDQMHDFHEYTEVAPPEEHPAEKQSRNNMILTAVLITISVWFILGTMFICYRMSATKSDPNVTKPAKNGDFSETSEAFSRKTSQKSGPSTRQLRINTCTCENTSAVIDSSHTEHRLPSITEISESEPTARRKITFPRSPTESTTCGSSTDRRCRSGEACYPSSDSDESSEEND